MFTTQFHVKEQGAAKPIHGRRRRQDESVSKKVLDIDRRFIDAYSALKLTLIAEDAEIRRGPQRKTVSLVVDSWCPRLLTLFVTHVIDKSILLGFLKTGDMAWRL